MKISATWSNLSEKKSTDSLPIRPDELVINKYYSEWFIFDNPFEK